MAGGVGKITIAELRILRYLAAANGGRMTATEIALKFRNRVPLRTRRTAMARLRESMEVMLLTAGPVAHGFAPQVFIITDRGRDRLKNNGEVHE